MQQCVMFYPLYLYVLPIRQNASIVLWACDTYVCTDGKTFEKTGLPCYSNNTIYVSWNNEYKYALRLEHILKYNCYSVTVISRRYIRMYTIEYRQDCKYN